MKLAILLLSGLASALVHGTGAVGRLPGCSLNGPLYNATYSPRRPDGFRECPASFTATLLEVGDGELFGACFRDMHEINGHHKTAPTCRQSCYQLGVEADLPVLPLPQVEAFLLDEVVIWPGQHYWLGLTDIAEEGKWTWANGAPLGNYTNWGSNEPNNWHLCGEHCATVSTWSAHHWVDTRCHEQFNCVCQVANVGIPRRACKQETASHKAPSYNAPEQATRDGVNIYNKAEWAKRKQKPVPEPFYHSEGFLVLVVASLAVVAGALFLSSRYATGDGDGGARASAVVGAAEITAEEFPRTPTRVRAKAIEDDVDKESEKFQARLDPQARFPHFLDNAEELLYATTACDKGFPDLVRTLKITMPGINLLVGLVCTVLFELPSRVIDHYNREEPELGSRSIVIIIQAAAIMFILLGNLLPRKHMTPELFPYVSFACAFLVIVAVFGLGIWIAVRYGSLRGNSPWDGQSRLLLAVLLIFLPRRLHLSIGFSTALSSVSIVALEVFLLSLYRLYNYNCSCYALFSNTRTVGSAPTLALDSQTHHPVSSPKTKLPKRAGNHHHSYLGLGPLLHLQRPPRQRALRAQVLSPTQGQERRRSPSNPDHTAKLFKPHPPSLPRHRILPGPKKPMRPSSRRTPTSQLPTRGSAKRSPFLG